jgi:hypothetical protein
MTNRAVTIDEMMEKIGTFSEQDAVDLIESSHNHSGISGTAGTRFSTVK